MTYPLPSRVPIGITLLLLGSGFSNPNTDWLQSKAAAETATANGANSTAFVPNQGQWAFPASYVVHTGAMTTYLEAQGWVFAVEEIVGADQLRKMMREPEYERKPLQLRGVAVRMHFADARERPDQQPEGKLSGYRNYLIGDAKNWRTRVPVYASVLYRGMYDGIDVRLRTKDSALEYDLLVAPGADLSQAIVEVEGHDALWLDQDGTLVMETARGAIRQPPPSTYELGPNGERSQVDCQYVVLSPRRFAFTVPGWTGEQALLIDPELVNSTYLGHQGEDTAHVIVGDPTKANDYMIAGVTKSPSYPTTLGAFDRTWDGGWDVFVTRMSPSLDKITWSTFLGGSSNDYATAMVVEKVTGDVIVAGHTESTTFPVDRLAFQTKLSGYLDGFVSRLDTTGTKLVASTYLGGKGDEMILDVVVNANQVTTITGSTGSYNYPTTTNAYSRWNNNTHVAIVSQLDGHMRNLLYSTMVGGTGIDRAYAVEEDKGFVTIAGLTNSVNFPVSAKAFDRTHNGDFDGFMTQLFVPATGKSLIASSTYLGGSGKDYIYDMVQDGYLGETYVTGTTKSYNFPTTGAAWDKKLDGPSDAFVTRFGPSLCTTAFSTFLGGSGHDSGNALAVAGDVVSVAGDTNSTDFPIEFFSHWQGRLGGNYDGFLTELDVWGSRILFSTYLGGSDFETVESVVSVDQSGRKLLAGYTYSPNFPTTPNTLRPLPWGGLDAFITELDTGLYGISRYGRPTPHCGAPITIHALGESNATNNKFGVGCIAPAWSFGYLLLSTKKANLPMFGFQLYVDPTPGQMIMVPVSTKFLILHTLDIPLNHTLRGLKGYAQYVWLRPCPGQWPFVSSDALAIDVW